MQHFTHFTSDNSHDILYHLTLIFVITTFSHRRVIILFVFFKTKDCCCVITPRSVQCSACSFSALFKCTVNIACALTLLVSQMATEQFLVHFVLRFSPCLRAYT